MIDKREVYDIVCNNSIFRYKDINDDQEYMHLALTDLQVKVMVDTFYDLFQLTEKKKQLVPLNFKKLTEDAITPAYAHIGEDACFDIYTSEEVTIEANKTVPVKTGIAFEIPKGYKLSIKNRSGITIKGLNGNYVRVMLGTVDQGYRNEVMVMTYNQENHDVVIPKHTKLAQIELEQVAIAKLCEVKEFESETQRGLNGFGSTGK